MIWYRKLLFVLQCLSQLAGISNPALQDKITLPWTLISCESEILIKWWQSLIIHLPISLSEPSCQWIYTTEPPAIPIYHFRMKESHLAIKLQHNPNVLSRKPVSTGLKILLFVSYFFLFVLSSSSFFWKERGWFRCSLILLICSRIRRGQKLSQSDNKVHDKQPEPPVLDVCKWSEKQLLKLRCLLFMNGNWPEIHQRGVNPWIHSPPEHKLQQDHPHWLATHDDMGLPRRTWGLVADHNVRPTVQIAHFRHACPVFPLINTVNFLATYILNV